MANDHSNIFLAHTKTNSRLVKADQIIQEISDLLGKEDFFLLKEDMSQIIEFNNIGILRKGNTNYILKNQRS